MTEEILQGVHVTAEDEQHCVTVEWIGEGQYGDYRVDDREDVPLLRFNVAKINDGEADDGENQSFCCQVDARSDGGMKQDLADMILAEVRDHEHIKGICERLSGYGASDVEAWKSALPAGPSV